MEGYSIILRQIDSAYFDHYKYLSERQKAP